MLTTKAETLIFRRWPGIGYHIPIYVVWDVTITLPPLHMGGDMEKEL